MSRFDINHVHAPIRRVRLSVADSVLWMAIGFAIGWMLGSIFNRFI